MLRLYLQDRSAWQYRVATVYTVSLRPCTCPIAACSYNCTENWTFLPSFLPSLHYNSLWVLRLYQWFRIRRLLHQCERRQCDCQGCLTRKMKPLHALRTTVVDRTVTVKSFSFVWVYAVVSKSVSKYAVKQCIIYCQ